MTTAKMTETAQTPTRPPSMYHNGAEWLDDLGDVPLNRVIFDPWPGTATEDDLLQKLEAEDIACELINGTLVEKPVGMYESQLAAVLIQILMNYIVPRGLGLASGGDGPLRLKLGLVRLPDVAFASTQRLREADVRRNPIPTLAPDLAVEILSKSNTRKEIERKTREYLAAGARLVWVINPETRSAVVHTSADRAETIDANGKLEGREVLPGFELSLGELFSTVDKILEPR